MLDSCVFLTYLEYMALIATWVKQIKKKPKPKLLHIYMQPIGELNCMAASNDPGYLSILISWFLTRLSRRNHMKGIFCFVFFIFLKNYICSGVCEGG